MALLPSAYRYDAANQALILVAPSDVRRVTGYEDFVDVGLTHDQQVLLSQTVGFSKATDMKCNNEN